MKSKVNQHEQETGSKQNDHSSEKPSRLPPPTEGWAGRGLIRTKCIKTATAFRRHGGILRRMLVAGASPLSGYSSKVGNHHQFNCGIIFVGSAVFHSIWRENSTVHNRVGIRQ